MKFIFLSVIYLSLQLFFNRKSITKDGNTMGVDEVVDNLKDGAKDLANNVKNLGENLADNAEDAFEDVTNKLNHGIVNQVLSQLSMKFVQINFKILNRFSKCRSIILS